MAVDVIDDLPKKGNKKSSKIAESDEEEQEMSDEEEDMMEDKPKKHHKKEKKEKKRSHKSHHKKLHSKRDHHKHGGHRAQVENASQENASVEEVSPKTAKKEDKKAKVKVVAEEVGDSYGSPNPKPSKYEKKLRNIFGQLKECKHIKLHNKEQKSQTLVQQGSDIAKIDGSENTVGQEFQMVKHPDQKKYMHYALKNSDGKWLNWNVETGEVMAG